MSNFTERILAIAGICTVLTATAAAGPGAVYTMTNSAQGNAIVVYARSADGMLSSPVLVPTGGYGTGTGLGSQGAIAITEGGRRLLAVNAGSNDITVFSVANSGLVVTDRELSGGKMPISIAIFDDMVFVLNGGPTANIAGFRLTTDGHLISVPAWARDLPGQAPAQVSFALSGTAVVITEKASNTITTYILGDEILSGPHTQPSSGQTPFGFGISRMETLVVSEAAGGAPGASTVSTYEVAESGSLRAITLALHTGQTAACWVAVTQNGRYAYIANTGSSTISSLAVASDGSLRLLNSVAGRTPQGTAPIDLAFSRNSQYLYALASGTISVFRASSDGSLGGVQITSGLPASTAGLIAQ
jgi:6-phosphogluconolactonase